ncbi:MAG: hypothetical protein WBC76_12380, partial [Actinomycetes bacterium]
MGGNLKSRGSEKSTAETAQPAGANDEDVGAFGCLKQAPGCVAGYQLPADVHIWSHVFGMVERLGQNMVGGLPELGFLGTPI